MRKAVILMALALMPEAAAQWGPTAGDWGKSESSDVRVMTWNVSDSLCRTANKDDSAHNWAAVARTVAALRPDVLLLQECADNVGNGTGTGIDSASISSNVIDLFLHGGTDTYLGGQVAYPIRLGMDGPRPGTRGPHGPGRCQPQWTGRRV